MDGLVKRLERQGREAMLQSRYADERGDPDSGFFWRGNASGLAYALYCVTGEEVDFEKRWRRAVRRAPSFAAVREP